MFFDPHAYWDRRHAKFGQSLRGVGHRGLEESQNLHDYRVKIDRLTSVLKASFPNPSGLMLLDAGCGTGYLSRTYQTLGFAVTGVDFSKEAIAEARSHGFGHFCVAPLDSFNLDRTFAAIVCIDVLFHVVHNETWKTVLKNLAKHLENDGTLVIQEHLTDEPSTEKHVKWRSKSDYQEALATAGLIVTMHHTYVLPNENKHKDILVCEHAPVPSVR
jgi:2-polyprenyl-3-methyl-5-hydroxy-6-metoxy-1,4-benzoquinol methylase